MDRRDFLKSIAAGLAASFVPLREVQAFSLVGEVSRRHAVMIPCRPGSSYGDEIDATEAVAALTDWVRTKCKPGTVFRIYGPELMDYGCMAGYAVITGTDSKRLTHLPLVFTGRA